MPASISEPLRAESRCQFSGGVCSTESNHYRKVISHIFGRNKKCTVNIPEHVWIYYCRKHYQRARYRTAEWPFRQCDLAIETIQNMLAWGGVESFNLQLRRRETWRTTIQANESNKDDENDKADDEEDIPDAKAEDHKAGESSPSGMAGTFTPINHNRSISSREEIGEADYDGNEEQHGAKSLMCNTPTEDITTTTTDRKKKRSPTIIPRPVPGWLHTRVGPYKTFNEILSILHDLRAHLAEIVHQEQIPHFPDIEILPNLYPLAVTPSRTVRAAVRPTLQPLIPFIDAPTPLTGPIISSPTQTLPRRRATSLTLHRPSFPSKTAVLGAKDTLEASAGHTGVRRDTYPSIALPVEDSDAADMAAEVSDNDASNTSLEFAIRRAVRLTNASRRVWRVSEHGAVNKTTKKKKK
ncbi:ORP1, hypothetical pathogenicity factor [Histoplasma ohiense]|nr:ORP1, hypothetical pathogenicity factor [Histoplasma ohiense (nom. inval.)]